MKNILHTIILLIICCSMMIIPGCDFDTGDYSNTDSDTGDYSDIDSDTGFDSDNGWDFKPISEIRENFPKTVEELKTREFDNLDFSNADFSFPEIDNIYELSLDAFLGKSAQEIYDFFSASLETLMPGKYSEEMKMNTIFFWDGENPDGTYQTIKDYKPTGDPVFPNPCFKTEDCYFEFRQGVLRWFDNAELMRYRGEEGAPIMPTMLTDSEQLKHFITDLNSTDKFELIDGEISVKDAVEFVDNYLATMNFSPYELSALTKTVAVSVLDIGNGKYGYNFITTPEYKNVLFDHYEVQGGNVVTTIENDYDDGRYDSMPGQIGMIETNKIYNFVEPAYNRSITETANYTSIITLENAAEIVTEFYSPTMNFDVKRVQVVYLAHWKSASPCWKFLMESNDLLYSTFVDMGSGEVYVYIQE